MGIGWMETLLIVLVVLLLFGKKRLPELAKSAGEAINEFKKAKDGDRDREKEDVRKDDADAAGK